MNIVSMAMNFVGPAVIDRIARSLGINSTLARTAVATALPAILAALSGKGGASASGAGSILDGLRGKGAGSLKSLDSMIGGPDEGHYIEAGRRDLDNVLGGGEMGPIMQAVSRFTGIEEGQSSALLGMMGPVALGTLGEEVSRRNLDAEGLSRLLSDQRQNIADALPNGFIDHVPGSGAFDAFKGNFVAGTVSATADPAPASARVDPSVTAAHPHADPAEPVHETKKSGGMLGWLLGLLALLLIGWFVFTNFIAPRDGDAPVEPVGIEQSLAPSELGSEISQSVDNIRTSLGSITDEASARVALPDLTAARENLDAVQATAADLPETQRGALSAIVANALATLQPIIDRVRGIPGVGPVVGPVLDGIVETMNDLG